MKEYIHSYVHSSIIYNSQDLETAKCPSVDECTKNLWYIYTMEYYTAIKRKILPLATAWVDLEIILLSEINQSEKDKYHMISLTCGI